MGQFISTSEIAAGCRLEYWNSFLQSVFPGMSVAADQDIDACWKSRNFGELRVARISSQRALVKRWQTTAPDPECLRTIAHLQSRGTSLTFHQNKATVNNRGDLVLSEADLPYAINVSDYNVVILIDFPREFLGVTIPAEGRIAARSEFVKQLHDFALFVLDDEFNELQDEEDSEECILGVFSTLLRKSVDVESAQECSDLPLCHRIFQFIDASIQDSALRTSAIARHLSVSPKQVQRILATIGMTPSQFILNRRVNLAAFMLRSSAFDGTVTDLAMNLGFSDAAHFCRSFRKILSVTPTEYARFQRQR